MNRNGLLRFVDSAGDRQACVHLQVQGGAGRGVAQESSGGAEENADVIRVWCRRSLTFNLLSAEPNYGNIRPLTWDLSACERAVVGMIEDNEH